MSSSQAFSRAIYATALVLLTCAAAGGSSSPGNGPTRLDAALSHIADTPGTRASIAFDDTARLVQLSGTSPGTTKGFAVLRG